MCVLKVGAANVTEIAEVAQERPQEQFHNYHGNFMCQLGWATVPRSMVKHHSGCVCDGATEGF